MKSNKIFSVLLCSSFFPAVLLSQHWPFLGNNDRGSITGTPGEIRTGNGHARFHGGVDITNPTPPQGSTSVAVYSVSAGTITWNDEAEGADNGANAWDAVITVGDRQYKHVRVFSGQFMRGQQITVNTHIGNMFSSDPSAGFPQHVHLNGVPSNIDVYDLFDPFSDEAAAGNPNGHLPVYWNWNDGQWVNQDNPNVLKFYTNGINYLTDETTHPNTIKLFGTGSMPQDVNLPQRGNYPATTHRVVFGDLDLVARVKDAGILEDGTPSASNNAPHNIEYKYCSQPRILAYPCISPRREFSLHNIPANNVVPPTAQFNSDNTFLRGSAYTGGNNRYIISNQNNEDGCLRTAQNGPTSDGRFVVGTRAMDIVNTSTEHFVPIIVDNFMPYIREVEIWKGHLLLVRNTWVFNSAGNTITLNKIENSVNEHTGNNVRVILRSSEPLRTEDLQVVLIPNAPFNPLPLGSPITVNDFETEFTYSVTVNNNPDAHYCVHIQGRDYANNQLLAPQMMPNYPNSVAVPRRIVTNTGWRWEPQQFSAGTDVVTCISGKRLCAFGGQLSEGVPISIISSPPECDCEPVASFNYMPSYDGLTLSFDASSSSGTQPLTYNWTFGDGSSSNGQMPVHIYAEGGTYVVILTVEDECGNTATASEVVAVTEGGPSSLDVEIIGPSQALPNQEVLFLANISGGVPPFTYSWQAVNGSPRPLPDDPHYNNGLHKKEQLIRFEESTPIGTATVYVSVTDAGGNQTSALHNIDISANALTLDFKHFPNSPSGHPSNPIKAGQYLYWVAEVNPLLETPYPADYTWNFGDGTAPVTEPNGQTEHTFENPGTYHVTLKMCDLFGSCISATRSYTVSADGGSGSGYVILPENTVSSHWGGPTQTVSLTRVGQPLCWLGLDANIRWEVVWKDCRYKPVSSAAPLGVSFNVNTPSFDELTDPHGIRPWGCLSAVANDYSNYPSGHCGTGQNNCALFMRPSALSVGNLRVESENNGCQYKLNADVFGGGWSFENTTSNASTPRKYKGYEWKVFDIDNPAEEIDILVDAGASSPAIVATHPYFDRFPSGEHIRFLVKLKVTDFANQIKEAGDVLSFNPFRLAIKNNYTRCPGVRSYFEDRPVATGGTRNYEFTWTTSGGSLEFESNDPNDPFPYFKAPDSGQKTYQLVVKMLDDNGAVLCQLAKQVQVSVSPLSVVMPATVGACSTAGSTVIGPMNLLNMGGSGKYGFEWTTADPNGLSYLSDVFSARPEVQGIPVGQTVVYTLRVGDLTAFCEATADIAVTGYANDVTLALPGTTTACYGEPATITGSASPHNSLYYEWTTNHPHNNLLQYFGGGSKPQLYFSELMNSYPGTYDVKLRATNFISGCFLEQSTTLTVRPLWKFKGYESTIISAVTGSAQDLWHPGIANYISSGVNLSQIEVEWTPYPPSEITYYGNTLLPSNGKFIPTKEVPYLTMTVHDLTTGCSKSFKSRRFVLSDAKPEFFITPDKTVTCAIADVCFDLVFDAHLANYSTSLIPPIIPVKVQFVAPDNVPQSPNSKTIYLGLPLVNNSGLYRQTICETEFFRYNQPGQGGYPYIVGVSPQTTNISPWQHLNINGTTSVLVAMLKALNDHILVCTPDDGVARVSYTYTFGITCNQNTSFGCHQRFFARDYIDFVPNGGNSLEIFQNQISPTPWTNFLIGSSECFLPPDGIEPLTTERYIEPDKPTEYISSPSLKVMPNPFTDEVAIQYVIPSTCEGSVIINLFDFSGRHLSVIEKRQSVEAGQFEVIFETGHLPSGVYFYELVTSGCRIVKKSIKI